LHSNSQCIDLCFLKLNIGNKYGLCSELKKCPSITKEGEIIKNLNKGEFYKYLGINQSNHIQHSIIKENLEKQFYLRIKSILKSKLNGNNLIKAVNTYAAPLLTYSFGIIKWSKTNLQNINIQTRVLFTKFCKHHPKSAIERFTLPRENGGRGFSNLEILQHNQIASLKNYFLNRARDNTFFNALVSADKGYTPLNLSDNIISDIVDTIANIKQKSLHGRYFKELEQPEINIQASHAWLKKSNIHPETEGFIFAIQDRVINTRNYKNTYAVYNRSLINVGFAELKGKPLNISFLLAPFWLKANIKNVMIYS
jgi:hypothetical protein